MARWYDAYELLGKNIDRLKFMEKGRRDRLLVGVMRLIRQHCPTLLDQFVLEFPLEINRRRWYDKDPYLWLIVNGLKYAEDELRNAVAAYLEDEYKRSGDNGASCSAVRPGQVV